jgi:hypothetical protein
VTQALSSRFESSALVAGDDFFEFIDRSFVPARTTGAHHQNEIVIAVGRREWGQVIIDQRLVAAIVYRMTFRAHIIETGTESFRLRTSRRGKT